MDSKSTVLLPKESTIAEASCPPPGQSRPASSTLDWLPQPEPAAGIEAYHRERALALASDDRKKRNYERFLQGRFTGNVDYLPIKLDIENVSRCNLQCRMCVVSDWDKRQRAGDLPLDDFEHLLEEQYGLVEIKLQGIGEPLMQNDVVFKMIRAARDRHIWVRTSTNATLLHLNNNFKKLIDGDVNELQVSVDGASRDVFEEIRRGARFDHVLENCKRLNAYANEQNVTRTKMWTVVQTSNLHQLEVIVELAASLGFRSQVFSLELTDWGLDHWSETNKNAAAGNLIDRERLEGLLRRGDDLGVKVAFWHVADKYRTGSPETACPCLSNALS